MTILEDTLELALQTQKELSKSGMDLELVLRNCLMIAQNLSDQETATWVKNELTGYEKGSELPSYRSVIGIAYEEFYEINRKVGYRVHGERSIAGKNRPVYEDIGTLISLSSQEEIKRELLPGDGTPSIPFKVHGAEYKKLVSKVTTRALEYICSVIRRLKYEASLSDIFEEKRQEVIKKLEKISPECVEKLDLALEDLKRNEKEASSHALISIRKMLKDLADKLHPAGDKEIDGHKMTDDRYISRLWEYLKSKQVGEKEREFNQSLLSYLAKCLQELNDLVNKGVHNDIAKDLAERIMLYTFLIISDLLHEGHGTSP